MRNNLPFHSAIKLLFCSIVVLASNWVNASAYQVVSQDTKIRYMEATSIEGADADLLLISPANTAGISLNEFSKFEVSDRPLKIVNTPTDEDAARLIVIISDHHVLANEIEVLGVASDVLFISAMGSGTITCTDCSFNNMYRVSLVTAQPTNSISSASSNIGVLTPNSGSNITISNLMAPGAISLELLTDNLLLNGEISTHLRATKDISGSYLIDPEGDYVVGAGQVDVLLGAVTWDYDVNEVVGVAHYGLEFWLEGVIKSAGVKLVSAGSIDVDTIIDTRSDLISPIKYQNSLYMPKEGVSVISFAEGDVKVHGDVLSAGDVSFKSKGKLELANNNQLVVGNIVELIAEDSVINLSEIHALDIKVAGNSFENEGVLLIDNALQVWAEMHIANQYGGHINASSIALKSISGVVRNGSRTPYRSRPSELAGSISLYQGDLVSFDPSKMGAFYGLGIDIDTAGADLQLPDDTSATILANEIRVNALAFENINPYYEFAIGDVDPVFDAELEAQVSIIASEKFEVLATNYFLNSSAWIEQHGSQNPVKIHSAKFQNERYRMVVSLEATNSYAGTRTYVNSPPAVLIGMGDIEVKATSSFINNVSFFEMFGNATVFTNNFSIYGMKNEGFDNGGWSAVTIRDPRVHTEQSDGGTKGIVYDNETQIQTKSIPSLRYGEEDSLFFVHGDLVSNSTVTFTAHQPLDSYLAQLMDQALASTKQNHTVIEKYSGTIKLNTSAFGRTDYQNMQSFHGFKDDKRHYRYYYDRFTASTNQEESIKKSGNIQVNWKDEWRMVQFRSDKSVHENNLRSTWKKSGTGTDTYSAFDMIKNFYNSMVDSIVSLYEEVKWWD